MIFHVVLHFQVCFLPCNPVAECKYLWHASSWHV